MHSAGSPPPARSAAPILAALPPDTAPRRESGACSLPGGTARSTWGCRTRRGYCARSSPPSGTAAARRESSRSAPASTRPQSGPRWTCSAAQTAPPPRAPRCWRGRRPAPTRAPGTASCRAPPPTARATWSPLAWANPFSCSPRSTQPRAARHPPAAAVKRRPYPTPQRRRRPRQSRRQCRPPRPAGSARCCHDARRGTRGGPRA
mmetsp:Transcript_9137/g.28339  ORF Transcript_9137/g.28339 Transcript_9137/m.28339 type:complete len:205 (+) Transcript_9137:139-753(+)